MRRALAQRRMLFHWDLVIGSGCLLYPYSIADGGWAASQGVEGRVQLTAQRPTPYPLGYLFYSAHYIWVPSA